MAKTIMRGCVEELTKDAFWQIAVPVPIAGCWLWPGTGGGGYGKINGMGALRWAYETFIGEIPNGMFVCHRCDVIGCVNPDHLFLGTNGDNASDMHRKRRGGYAIRDKCKHGHPFTPENTYTYRGARCCRACNRAAAMRSKAYS